MPRRNYVGDFSRASFTALEFATALQGMAVDNIKKTFASESTGINLDDISMEEFTKALLEADERGEREQFEAQIAAIIRAHLEMMAQQQQQVPQ